MDELSMSIEDHIAWTDSINLRLDCIYNELCEFEMILNQAEEEPLMPLMELIESVNEMHAAAQNIHPLNATGAEKKNDLHEQIELLERSLDLLKLESQTKRVELME